MVSSTSSQVLEVVSSTTITLAAEFGSTLSTYIIESSYPRTAVFSNTIVSAQSPSPSHSSTSFKVVAIISSYSTTSTVNSISNIIPTPTSTVQWYRNATVWNTTTSTVNFTSAITPKPTSTVQWYVTTTVWNTTTSTVNSSSVRTPASTSTVQWYVNATVWNTTTSTVNSSSTITPTPTSTVQWFVNVTVWNTTTSSAIIPTPSTTVRSVSTSVISTTSTPWPTSPPSYNQTTPTEPEYTTPAISTTAPTTTPGPDPIMYPYGVEANDLQDTADYYYWTCPEVQLDMRGIAFFGRRHFKLYICRNGLISFNHRWYRRWPYNFGQHYWFDSEAILAPYWALIDRRQAFREGVSKLFYHLYKEGDSNPATIHILRRATEDVNKHMRYNPLPTEFTKPIFVLVVTWVKIRHWYSEWRPELRNKYNTFQAVLITDSVYSFVMYNYPANGIQWSAPADREDYSRYWNDKGLPVVGLNAGDKEKIYYNHPRSGRVNIVDIDRIDGLNVFKSSESTSSLRETLNGMRGRIFIRLEDSLGLEDARLKCVTWYYQQGDPRAFTQSLEPCPCTEWQGRRDRRFRITTWDWNRVCYYSQFPSSEGWGQECCYKFERVRRWWWWWSWIEYLANGYPDGGNAHRFHKYRYPKEYEKDDKHAYEHCCIHSNMCWMYQEARPSDTCSRYIPPRWSWFWGDPHFVTLDGMNYTFNGLGEYVMLDAKDGYFQLQARTKIAKGEGTATVFSGAVAKERNTSTVQVTLVDDNGTMEVMVDGKIFDIKNLTNSSVALDGSVSISKPEKRCFEMSFPSGMSVKTCEKHQQLSIIAAAPNSFKNTTKGLLGTWNGDPTDDFTLPNGTILSNDMSGKDVHYKFGLAWQVTNKTSLFTYKEGESFATFLNESFSPMFVEDLKFANTSLKEEAEKLCQGDVSCLFDAVSTQDLEVGLSTKQLGSQLVNDSKKMSNEPPKISNGSAVIELQVNTTAIVIVEVTDADGDTISFNVSGLPPDGVVSPLNSSFWKITWFVTTNKLNLQFTAMAGDAVSVLQPKIYLCACHHGGNCEKPSKITGADSGEQKFVIMTCSCVSGYTGTYCEADIDACEANLNPCYPRVTCIDLPPPANMTDGYKCGPCPTGYTGNGASCTDIDECSVNNGGCSQLCGNTPGSYVCSCMNGYQLKADRKSCDDIDECYPVSNCMQKCINTPGSYNCSCNENFKIDPAKPKLCVPKNPCKDGDENGCDQVCYLVDNERKCACNKGYELNDDQKSCRDVDECAAKKSRCNQKCHDEIGGYTCSCLDGFVLSSDNRTCVDINECMEWTFNCTDSSQLCVNTDGSYKCECEEGLYWIDNKCKGLKRGQTPPSPPPAPEPKTPNQNETLNAVNITMRNFNVSEWNKPREDKFKEVIAEATTSYCSKTDSECSVKVMRVRRSTEFITWTEDEIHRMPGFPIQIISEKYPASSLVARLAFYVNFPRSVMLQTGRTLSNDIVLKILNASRGAIENALNASIIGWSIYKEKPEEEEEEEETSKEKKDMLPIIIGASVGGTLFILLIVVIVIICHKREQRKVNHQSPPEDIQMRIAVAAVSEGVEQQPDYYNYPLRARPVKFLRE